ncbi:uncharacterized protein PAC_15929 [Phialocephala subalpina]|uniref:Uncharacterized protein n=1 Tax=Phialocephala subalpina TaxID=576137 RepID=A0A1L7XLW4_9HELO|nr:uncharacterized protein PAC_15929 [Phialocephala subalpina]
MATQGPTEAQIREAWQRGPTEAERKEAWERLGGKWHQISFGDEVRPRTELGAWILDQVMGFQDSQSEEELGYQIAVEKLRDAEDEGWVERREVLPQEPEEAARAAAATMAQMQNIIQEAGAREEAEQERRRQRGY